MKFCLLESGVVAVFFFGTSHLECRQDGASVKRRPLHFSNSSSFDSVSVIIALIIIPTSTRFIFSHHRRPFDSKPRHDSLYYCSRFPEQHKFSFHRAVLVQNTFVVQKDTSVGTSQRYRQSVLPLQENTFVVQKNTPFLAPGAMLTQTVPGPFLCVLEGAKFDRNFGSLAH